MSQAADNAAKMINIPVAPTDGDVLTFRTETNDFRPEQPAEASPGGAAGYTKYSYTFADFVTGRETETNTELTVVTRDAGTVLDDVKVFVDNWNDPGNIGDGLTSQVNIDGYPLFGDNSVFIEDQTKYINVAQARIDSSTKRVSDSSTILSIVINAAEFGAHTMGDLTRGTVDVYVKMTALE